MKFIKDLKGRFEVILVLLITICSLSDCYDPLDPNGNITVTFDLLQWTADGYLARITIRNYYQYRHVDKPGWSLGWTWAKDEVIWSMSGAVVTKQGNCSKFTNEIPHSCEKNPVMVDLMPEAMPENMSEFCCHGGLLSASAISPSESFSSFVMKVGNLMGKYNAYTPLNLSLMAPGPGYTCGVFEDTNPTVSPVVGGIREEQVFRTWRSTCTYSSYLANKTPACCVSLSTFYNPKITPCPSCSCGCRLSDSTTKSCIREGAQASSEPEIVWCTDHMCPIQVHWHIKNNYRDHWRVKMTISNYNYHRNYSDWTLVVQHPGFGQATTTYSFNSTVLPTSGVPDEIALFWGIQFYNDLLLQANEQQVGSVTTEILMQKDLSSFTLSNGWALPRRIYFNGENCEMPLPDTFPMLPNGSSSLTPAYNNLCLLFLIYLVHNTIFAWF